MELGQQGEEEEKEKEKRKRNEEGNEDKVEARVSSEEERSGVMREICEKIMSTTLHSVHMHDTFRFCSKSFFTTEGAGETCIVTGQLRRRKREGGR